MMHPFAAALTIAGLISVAILPVYGQDATHQALNEITDTADRICGTVAQSGQYDSFKVSGSVKAELTGLVKKLANLGVIGSGEVSSAHYESVLQQELAHTLKDVRDCKLKTLEILKDTLLPSRHSDSASSHSQLGGQTAGTINNNGSVFNGPVAPPPPSVNGDCNIFGNNNNLNCPHYGPQRRSINDATATAIEHAAREAGPHKFAVWLTGNDPDVGPYSSNLISILKKGGWTGDIGGETGMSFPPPQDVGLHLCGKSVAPPESATALLTILLQNDQDVSRTYATCDKFGAEFPQPFLNFDDESVGIIIGREGPSSPQNLSLIQPARGQRL
jgi:hypothetical protein